MVKKMSIATNLLVVGEIIILDGLYP